MKSSWRQTGTITIRLGKSELAFLRGYLDGIALPVLAQRYLAFDPRSPSARLLKDYLKGIRDQIMVIAQRGGREFRDARLLLIDPEKLRASRRNQMTLEEFREERDPHEMYSEAELLEIYQEAMAEAAVPDRRAQRNERLRRRQVKVLADLETLLHADPAPSDGVAGWLEPALAGRLAAAGVYTLADLVALINARGYRWWTQVPKVGEKAARSVVAWLHSPYVAGSLKLVVEPHALKRHKVLKAENRARVQDLRIPSSAIAPIEVFSPPSTLEADRQAVLAWLERYRLKPATFRAYRKEAERLVLFCTLELGTPIATLDLAVYSQFLDRLASSSPADWPYRIPMSAWIGDPKAKRWTARWRPFAGPLSDKSKKLALDVSHALLRHLSSR